MVTEPRTFDAEEDPGTPESVWAADTFDYPALDVTGCARIVVVAPHPDDEILGIGGLLRRAAASGTEVLVVAVTDGAASHPGSPTVSPDDLRRLRPLESVRALQRLGITRPPVRLELDDGAVPGTEHRIADAVAPLLTADTWCFAPWRGDRHPDHEATGRAGAGAVQATGAVLVEYPIWMWHWARPGRPEVPWSRGRALTLTADEVSAKAAAIGEFSTQIQDLSAHPADRAVLPAHVLARFGRQFEVVFV